MIFLQNFGQTFSYWKSRLCNELSQPVLEAVMQSVTFDPPRHTRNGGERADWLKADYVLRR